MTENIPTPEPCEHKDIINTLAGPKCTRCGRIVKDDNN